MHRVELLTEGSGCVGINSPLVFSILILRAEKRHEKQAARAYYFDTAPSKRRVFLFPVEDNGAGKKTK